MLEVHHDGGSSEDQCDVHSRILNSDASVGAAAEQNVVLRVLVGRSFGIEPTFGNEIVGLREDFGVMHGVEEGGDDHAVGGNGIIVRNGEGPECLVRYLRTTTYEEDVVVKKNKSTDHGDGGFDSHALFHDGLKIWHLVNHFEGKVLLVVALADSFLFLPDFGKNLGMVSEVLESVD